MKLDDSQPQAGNAAPALRERFERLRALRSAWGVLALSAISAGGHPVAEIGRVLSDHLNDLAGKQPEALDDQTLSMADAGLDEFARMLRTIAFQIPIDELRAILPTRVRTDRRGVLDVLDLMIDFENGMGKSSEHVGAIDYVITLLCTAGGAAQDRGIRHDPATLTPRLHALCQRAEASEDPERLADIEAEFFAASSMDTADVQDEMQHRTLRRRKTQLGAAFYAPGVLRAIVTYNAALLQRVTDEISDSQDWGAMPCDSAEVEVDAESSVFASDGLLALADAIRRRSKGCAPEIGPVDRIAWCLDLDFLDEAETSALVGPGVGSADNPRGTATLVGLLNRSLVVLADELPGIGISPDALATGWVRELEAALKAETNQLITGDSYEEACAVAALKSKLLNPSQTEPPRARPPRRPAPERTKERDEPEKPVNVLETARQLANDALAQKERADAPGTNGWTAPDWARGVAVVAATLAVVMLGANFVRVSTDSELDRFSGRQLEVVSPYLAKGHRNGEGTGTGFVGTLDSAWDELGEEARTEAALDLVASLRAQGVREIMVYDRDGALRLQVLGDQPMQVVP